jgi:hypothetical protein
MSSLPLVLTTIATAVVCALLFAALIIWADYLPDPLLEGASSSITQAIIMACVAIMKAAFDTTK